ncbi:MAG TPA: ABC transporter ATP-binding protein, partial [Spirochaetia bacterium]|nr:ABC transporter ATP-binding protein [Spirochaetia bacterium]
THYGHVEALKGIDITVPDGALVAMLGANGAGKSTTLMTISGILRPSAGTITYDGMDLSRLDARQIVELGVIHCPEGRRIFGTLTVIENLRMGAVSRKDKRRLHDAFDQVFTIFPVLAERRNQSGSTLSGGEQQMLAIGRALMARPRLLLLDEPSLGLAPIVVTAIFDVIRQLHRDGVTILLVEQNAEQALSVANEGYIMETGTIVLHGQSETLKSNPEVERIYLSDVPRSDAP